MACIRSMGLGCLSCRVLLDLRGCPADPGCFVRSLQLSLDPHIQWVGDPQAVCFPARQPPEKNPGRYTLGTAGLLACVTRPACCCSGLRQRLSVVPALL